MNILNDDINQRLIIQNKCQNQGECAICYESFHMKQVVLLPCKHMFHNSCFKKTLDHRSYKCALCRFDITAALGKTGFNFPPGFYANANANITTIAYTNTVEFATLFAFTEFDFMPALINDDSDDDTAATDTNSTDSDEAIDAHLHENFWTNILLNMNNPDEPQTDTAANTDTGAAGSGSGSGSGTGSGSGSGTGSGVRDISYNISLLYFYL